MPFSSSGLWDWLMVKVEVKQVRVSAHFRRALFYCFKIQMFTLEKTLNGVEQNKTNGTSSIHINVTVHLVPSLKPLRQRKTTRRRFLTSSPKPPCSCPTERPLSLHQSRVRLPTPGLQALR